MLLEGPSWVERLLQPPTGAEAAALAQVGDDIYRTVGGYVTGNLAISLIAGIVSTLVLLGLGRAVCASRSGSLVGLLDLIPLAGATIAAVDVSHGRASSTRPRRDHRARLLHRLPAAREPCAAAIVYGRTVQLSPLAVLIAVLIGAELAGVIGALAAIPVAGAIQVLLLDWLGTAELGARRRPSRPSSVPETFILYKL